jgi:hypothetical protein
MVAIVLVCAAALAACGGGDQQSSGPSQSPAGVWGFTNDPSIPRAMIDSAGEAIFVTSDGEIFRGSAQVSGSDLTIAVEGYSVQGSTFSDGSTHGTGELVGTVTTGGTLSATLTFTSDGGTPITATWTLPYYSFYEISSLSDISSAGGYTGGFDDPGTLIFIDPNGLMSSQTALDGCVLSGLVSTADTAHNVYEVSYSYTGCSGASQVLNDVQFTGLAFNSTNDVPGNLAPPQFTFVATGASATAKYGALFTLVS